MKKICTLAFFATLLFSTHLFASQEKTPLVDAVKKGDLNEVKRLVKDRVNPHVVCEYKINLIHVAASFGHISIIEYLKTIGVDCNKKDEDGCTPSLFAALNGKLDTLKYLIEKCDVDPYVVNKRKENLAHYAAQEGHVPIIEYLKKIGVDCDKKNKYGSTPLLLAARSGKLDTLKYLIEKCDVDPYVVNKRKENLAYYTAKFGHVPIIEYLKTIDVDCDKKNKYGSTTLLLAAQNGKLDTLKYLIEKCDVDPHVVNIAESNLAHYAAQKGHIPIIEYLKKIGVDCDKKNKYGSTPLLLAALNGKLDTLKYLIVECGASSCHIDLLFDNTEKKISVSKKLEFLNDLAKHKLLPTESAGKPFINVFFNSGKPLIDEVSLDHTYISHYLLQNKNLKKCNRVTVMEALKKKKLTRKKLYYTSAKQILLEKPRVLLKWPEFIPSILYNYGLYEKTTMLSLLKSQNLLKNKNRALKHLLETKQFAKIIANNPDESPEDKRYSKQFGQSLNKTTMLLWDLSKIMPQEVAAKTLTYASIK